MSRSISEWSFQPKSSLQIVVNLLQLDTSNKTVIMGGELYVF